MQPLQRGQNEKKQKLNKKQVRNVLLRRVPNTWGLGKNIDRRHIFLFSYVTCHMSLITCNLSPTPMARATDPSSANFPAMHSWSVCKDPDFVLGNQPIYQKNKRNKSKHKISPKGQSNVKKAILSCMSCQNCQCRRQCL